MRFFTRIKKGILNLYYQKRYEKAINKMEEHKFDVDGSEWNKWLNIALDCCKKEGNLAIIK